MEGKNGHIFFQASGMFPLTCTVMRLIIIIIGPGPGVRLYWSAKGTVCKNKKNLQELKLRLHDTEILVGD